MRKDYKLPDKQKDDGTHYQRERRRLATGRSRHPARCLLSVKHRYPTNGYDDQYKTSILTVNATQGGFWI